MVINSPAIGGSMPTAGISDTAFPAAVEWIAAHPEGVPVHEVKQRFGMTALQACEAIKAARDAGTPSLICKEIKVYDKDASTAE